VKLLLVTGGVFLLAGDLTQMLRPEGVAWTVLLAIAFVCFAPGLTLIPVGVVSRNATIIGAALAVIGAVAGAAMQVLFRVQAVLRDAGQADALAALSTSEILTMTTLIPGILFPLGLLVLAIALRRNIGNLAALLLAAAAVMFPIGHAVAIMPVALLGDLVLLVAFWMFRP
jgi:hypothetical protein